MLSILSYWKRLFYFSHVFSILAALGYILCAYFTQVTEGFTVGEFNLNITHTICVIYYAVSGFLIAASVVGFLAQKINHKPSLWILYCILMSILSLVEMSLAGIALNKVGSGHKNAKHILKLSMEEYVREDGEAARHWDSMHIKHKCCGVESYQEWQDVPYGRTTLRTPKSCCLPPNNSDIYCSLNVLPVHDQADKIVYTRGCLKPALEQLNAQLTIVGSFGMTIAVLNCTIVTLTCYLVITKRV